ncbi:MAG: PIN domain-containing protein [Thermoanaerobaculia bacterium]
MTERFVVDTNAVINYLRLDCEYPRQLDEAKEVFLPLTVIGELFFGAARSNRSEQHRTSIARIIRRWPPLMPDLDTARIYGDIRAAASRSEVSLKASKVNDFWIAALCIQHQIPLLTNDGGFDRIDSLTVIHW